MRVAVGVRESLVLTGAPNAAPNLYEEHAGTLTGTGIGAVATRTLRVYLRTLRGRACCR